MKRIFVVLLVLLLSCKKDDPVPGDTQIIEQYLEDNTITAEITGGVYRYEIADNPAGNDQGSIFSIYYELSDLETGDVIDSHQATDGDPIKLKQGSAAVLPVGLDNGLAGIREGETYGIILPQKLGYGNFNVSSINPKTILHFEVEVVSRQTESEIATEEDQAINDYITANDLNNTTANPVDPVMSLSNGVYYKKTANGNGNVPASGDSITVDYDGRFLDDSSFDALDGFKYKYDISSVISGFDTGVAEMEESESATIFIPSAQAYGGSVRVIPESVSEELQEQFVIPFYVLKIEPYKVLIFDVTLQTIH